MRFLIQIFIDFPPWITFHVSTFQLLDKNPANEIKAETLKQLKSFKGNKIMDFRLYYYPKRIGKHAPGFYGHLKLHKPVTNGWPFLLYGGFSIYNLNRYIANTLKTYAKDEKNYVRNWTIFPKFLKDVPIENGKNNLIWRNPLYQVC